MCLYFYVSFPVHCTVWSVFLNCVTLTCLFCTLLSLCCGCADGHFMVPRSTSSQGITLCVQNVSGPVNTHSTLEALQFGNRDHHYAIILMDNLIVTRYTALNASRVSNPITGIRHVLSSQRILIENK